MTSTGDDDNTDFDDAFDDVLDDVFDNERALSDVVNDALANGSLNRLLCAAHEAPELHDDLMVALVALGLEQARASLHASPRFAGVDVDGVVAHARRNASIRQAIEQRVGLAELIDVIESSPCSDQDRASWLQVAARRFRLDTIAQHAAHCPRGAALELLRTALSHHDRLAAFEALVGAVDVETVAVLAQPLGLSDVAEPASTLTVARIHAAHLVQAGRSLSAALPRIDVTTPIDVWLPVFQRLGLPASAAVLELRERWRVLAVLDVVRHMVAAGYRDDLLEGLRKNGFGITPSMQHLAQCGWHVDQMVDDLLRNGMLLPDVRDELVGLGLSAPAIGDVLLRHAPADVVDLVMR